LRSFLTRSRAKGRPDLPLLSVNLPDGVVLRRDDDGRPAPAEDLSGYQVVRSGNLVMNQLGKPHGALGVSPYDGIISPAYFVARIGDAADSRFVHHLLRTRRYISEYERRGKHMPPSQFDISWDQFRSIPIALPPVPEQRAIADFLDTETTRVDALITKKRHMIGLLGDRHLIRVYRGVTGADVVGPKRASGVDWIGELPAHWGVPWLGAHYETQLGKMLNADAAMGPEQFPYVRNTNVQWDRFDLEDLATMHFGPEDRARCQLRTGDLLVCEGGEVGRAAVWADQPQEVYFQKAIHRVRPIRDGNTRFLMYCLRAAAYLNVFTIEGNLSTIIHLTGEKLREHRFPFPSLEDQAVIVRDLDADRNQTRKLTYALGRQLALLQEHRDALITAAVTGELAVPGVAA
jgi:type I restriction enzyme S subunit